MLEERKYCWTYVRWHTFVFNRIAPPSALHANVDTATPAKTVPLPETLLDSCWKVILELRGVKSDKNRVPIRLTFCCKFAADDYILEVEPNHRFVKRCVRLHAG